MEKLSVVGGGGEGNCIIKIINNFKAARCVIALKLYYTIIRQS